MCGIAGFIAREGVASAALPVLQRMTRALAHRGPDGEGYWQSADGRVNLGHRRLAIIDLTPSGHQPMLTRGGGAAISFNGEIYNFPELRDELTKQGISFRGSSDTEVLLEALSQWGVEPTLKRLNGMFAFAFWDQRERKLWLARDRFGEKPLYYSWQNGTFFFASELKPLIQHPKFRREIDRTVLPSYLRFNHVPGHQCIYKDVSKLTPGHCLAVDLSGEVRASQPYWRLRECVESRRLDLRAPDDPALIDELDSILSKAVRQRMLSDVPLGAFLSGGIDSSIVVALMQKQSMRPIKTFTIGFSDRGYNEAIDAGKVARHLGAEHHEYYISSKDCFDVIARLPQIYDEPFADSSQIPTTLVSQFTRRHVSVALSGDAGDEMFCGYNRYVWSKRIWPIINRFPPRIRRIARDLAYCLSPKEWDRIFSVFNPLVPDRLKVRGAGDKLHKLATVIGAKDTDALYLSYVSLWHDPNQITPGFSEAPSLLDDPQVCPDGLDYIEKMMYLDQLTYLTSDILCKVDRATMSAGLEARVPFVDNEVANFAWSLPVSTKLHRGISTWPLRQVPKALVDRPKMGFGVPIGEWLRGPLRDWSESLLDEQLLKEEGYFDAAKVRSTWSEHLAGRRNHQHTLWGILMFQAWNGYWR